MVDSIPFGARKREKRKPMMMTMTKTFAAMIIFSIHFFKRLNSSSCSLNRFCDIKYKLNYIMEESLVIKSQKLAKCAPKSPSILAVESCDIEASSP